MNKIKLRARVLDGETLVTHSPDFTLIDGWSEAALPNPAGILPAGLCGKVPGGDPYLLHINVLSTMPLGGGDIFELQSGAPIQPRARFRPTPSNYQLLLVRPTDRLRARIRHTGNSNQIENIRLFVHHGKGIQCCSSCAMNTGRSCDCGMAKA